MLILYFSNNLATYEYVGKFPEQYFSVWLFSNPGDKILFLLKFNEARISEWNIRKYYKEFFPSHVSKGLNGNVMAAAAKMDDFGGLTKQKCLRVYY